MFFAGIHSNITMKNIVSNLYYRKQFCLAENTKHQCMKRQVHLILTYLPDRSYTCKIVIDKETIESTLQINTLMSRILKIKYEYFSGTKISIIKRKIRTKKSYR